MFAIFLQYLKKEARDGLNFLHEGKHQSFCKLALLFLMEVPECPKYPKYFYCDAKYLNNLRVPVMFILIFFTI